MALPLKKNNNEYYDLKFKKFAMPYVKGFLSNISPSYYEEIIDFDYEDLLNSKYRTKKDYQYYKKNDERGYDFRIWLKDHYSWYNSSQSDCSFISIQFGVFKINIENIVFKNKKKLTKLFLKKSNYNPHLNEYELIYYEFYKIIQFEAENLLMNYFGKILTPYMSDLKIRISDDISVKNIIKNIKNTDFEFINNNKNENLNLWGYKWILKQFGFDCDLDSIWEIFIEIEKDQQLNLNEELIEFGSVNLWVSQFMKNSELKTIELAINEIDNNILRNFCEKYYSIDIFKESSDYSYFIYKYVSSEDEFGENQFREKEFSENLLKLRLFLKNKGFDFEYSELIVLLNYVFIDILYQKFCNEMNEINSNSYFSILKHYYNVYNKNREDHIDFYGDVNGDMDIFDENDEQLKKYINKLFIRYKNIKNNLDYYDTLYN